MAGASSCSNSTFRQPGSFLKGLLFNSSYTQSGPNSLFGGHSRLRASKSIVHGVCSSYHLSVSVSPSAGGAAPESRPVVGRDVGRWSGGGSGLWAARPVVLRAPVPRALTFTMLTQPAIGHQRLQVFFHRIPVSAGHFDNLADGQAAMFLGQLQYLQG